MLLHAEVKSQDNSDGIFAVKREADRTERFDLSGVRASKIISVAATGGGDLLGRLRRSLKRDHSVKRDRMESCTGKRTERRQK
jgi:hypothetical protein